MKTQQIGPGFFQQSMETVCDECPNVKFVAEDFFLEVEIEPGMPDGHIIKFDMEGEPHMDGVHGDLNFHLHTAPHPRFERRNDDLYTNVTISLLDALAGFSLEIPHLDAHTVTLDRAKITRPGQVLKVKHEGMPKYSNPSKRGNLYVTFDVEFPKEPFDDEAKKTLSDLLQGVSEQKVYNGFRQMS
eukprot:Rmarinus@m.24513